MSDRRKSPVELEDIEPHSCSLDLRLEILHGLPFFADLNHSEISEINRSFSEVGLTPGEMVYHAGDPADHLYVVAAGKIKLIRHTLQGKDVLLDLLSKGEHFGSLSPSTTIEYEDSAQALTSACVLVIGSESFRKILTRYPSVSLHLVDLIQQRLQSSHRRIQWLSLQSVDQRVAYLLLYLAEKFGDPSPMGTLIQIPLSRDALAEMAGTTPESASRSMSKLQKQGLIETGRQWVAVKDLAALKEQVGEES